MAKDTSKPRSCLRLCRKCISFVLSMFKALLARCLFFVHSLVAIWRVVDTTGDTQLWILGVALIALLIEFLVALKYKGGNESRWFSPVIFLYLCSCVPAIWFLELDLFKMRLQEREEVLNITSEQRLPRNFSLDIDKSYGIPERPDYLSGIHALGLDIHIPLALEPNQWAKILEQLLLLILIVGRWLLPKGALSRDQLSQLLLVNIGMAADIIELFEAFGEEKVKYNWSLTVVILSLWTISLLQFTLIQTTTKARRVRIAMTKRDAEEKRQCFCFETEIWAIMTSLLMQDLPFLCLRLVLITNYEVVSYMNIFFTSKNSLITVLQIYRIIVIQTEETKKHRKRTYDKSSEFMANIMDDGTPKIKRQKQKYMFNVDSPTLSRLNRNHVDPLDEIRPITKRAHLAQMDNISLESDISERKQTIRTPIRSAKVGAAKVGVHPDLDLRKTEVARKKTNDTQAKQKTKGELNTINGGLRSK